MAVTEITRDWGNNPSIVRMVTNNTFENVCAKGYLNLVDFQIRELNSGEFEWTPTDLILVSYVVNAFNPPFQPGVGVGFFTRNAPTNSLIPVGDVTHAMAFNSGEILGLFNVPILLVPNPPEVDNTIVRVNWVLYDYIFVTTPYAGGGTVVVEYQNVPGGTGASAAATMSGLFENGASATFLVPGEPGVIVPRTDILAQPVYLSNTDAPFTGGDGTLTVYINYTYMNIV